MTRAGGGELAEAATLCRQRMTPAEVAVMVAHPSPGAFAAPAFTWPYDAAIATANATKRLRNLAPDVIGTNSAACVVRYLSAQVR